MVKFVPLPPTIYMENAKGTTNFIIKVLHINITMDILDNTLTKWLRYIYIYIYYKNDTSIYHVTVFWLK